MCCSRCAAHFCFACLQRQPSAEAAHRHVPAFHGCDSVFAPLATVQAAQNTHRLLVLGQLLRLDAVSACTTSEITATGPVEWRDVLPGGASAEALVAALAADLASLGLPASLSAVADQWQQSMANAKKEEPANSEDRRPMFAAAGAQLPAHQHQLRIQLPPGTHIGPDGDVPLDVLPGLRASIRAQLSAQQPRLLEQPGQAALEELSSRHLNNMLALIRRQVLQQRQQHQQHQHLQQQRQAHPGLLPGRRMAGESSSTLLPLSGSGEGATLRAKSLRLNCQRGNWEAVVQLLHAFGSSPGGGQGVGPGGEGESGDDEQEGSGAVDWTEGDALGRTLLQLVILAGGDGVAPRDSEACEEAVSRVALLLAHGCDATAKAEHGHTPLVTPQPASCLCARSEMRALQIPPALAAALSHSSPSLPAQHLAVVSQNLKVVELLADNLVARADAAAAQARAARMAARAAVGARAAAEANAETTADETEAALDVRDFSLKAWVDAALPDGRTPLHLACSAGHPAMVAALLQRGADPATQATRSGGTCLQTAITAAAPDAAFAIVRLVLCGDAGPEARGHGGVRRRLLELPGEHGCTLLHHAVWRRHLRLVAFLVDHCKCDIEVSLCRPCTTLTPPLFLPCAPSFALNRTFFCVGCLSGGDPSQQPHPACLRLRVGFNRRRALAR
jgi:hypothetical protein